jgi:hypothetical protein
MIRIASWAEWNAHRKNSPLTLRRSANQSSLNSPPVSMLGLPQPGLIPQSMNSPPVSMLGLPLQGGIATFCSSAPGGYTLLAVYVDDASALGSDIVSAEVARVANDLVYSTQQMGRIAQL